MDQSNARSETGANNSPANSQPVLPPRPPRNSRPPEQRATLPKREETQQGTTQHSQDDSNEPKRLSLAELFSQDESGNIRDSDANVDDSADSNAPPDSVEAVLKRLGLKDPKEFYAIKVPMPNGAEPLPIGELKDRIGELVDLETREMQFEQRRMRTEGETLRAQAEMRELMALIPRDKITPELVNKIRQRHEATQKKERELTLETIPDWQNETRRTEDISGMIEMLGDYGFDESFITTVVDHRALKFIRDAYLTQKRIKAALAKVTVPQKKGGHRPSSKTAKGAAKPSAHEPSTRRTGVVPDQRTRIAELFNKSE